MRVGRFELIDQRVLAAIRFVDAVSGLPIKDAFVLTGVRSTRNSAGLYVLLAPEPADAELYPYHDGFRDTSATPAIGDVQLNVGVVAPSGRYLARRFSLPVPLQSADAAAPNYLLKPIAITMFPSATLTIERSWAVLRLSITKQGSNPAQALGGVLLRMFSVPANPAATPELLGSGLSDVRGEALVVAPRLRVLTLSAPEVTVAVDARRDTRLDHSLPDTDQLLAAPADAEWLAQTQTPNLTIAPGRITADTISMP
jgi:hypothetical protein